jgi:hypothetical protein
MKILLVINNLTFLIGCRGVGLQHDEDPPRNK